MSRNTSERRGRTKVKKICKEENFSEWFDRVLLEAQIADDRYPVKGFTVYMGWGFSIAKRIIQMLEEKLEDESHQPMQFPVVIPEDSFEKEAEHIAGFSSEVFWITHAGDHKLERRLVLRPTSETAIYPLFKIWIRSHADLPLRMHQTCSVYRYETKATRPLYRGREFLWNEAHTAHSKFDEAERQVAKAVEIYSYVYDQLGLSYIILKRPDFDKFAGAVYSLAFDTWNPDGKVNQIGTVHELGENFARAFELTFEDVNGHQQLASTTCYGMGMGRTLAATISHHGDDHGLVLPPIVAPKQIVIIPILYKESEKTVIAYAKELEEILRNAEMRVILDDDDRFRPGEKFYKWEMSGIPLRIEVGPRENEERTVTIVRRDTLKRSKIDLDRIIDTVIELLNDISRNLKERSWERLRKEVVVAENFNQLKSLMDERKIVMVNWCSSAECANRIKDEVAGEVRGTLWSRPVETTGPCIACGGSSTEIAYISRTY